MWRRVAGQGRQALEPVAEPVDQAEVGLEPGAVVRVEAGRYRPVLLVGEVQGAAPVGADRVAGGRRSEDAVPGPQRRVLGREPHAAAVVADRTAGFERGVDRDLQRRQTVRAGDVRGDELVEGGRDGAGVAAGEVRVVAGPGVDPAAVVPVAAAVEFGRGQRQAVQGEDAAAVLVERRQRPAERRLRELLQVDRPGFALGDALRTHLPGGVGPAMAVADQDQPADLGGALGQCAQGAARPAGAERGQPSELQQVASRDHPSTPEPVSAARWRKRSLVAMLTRSSLTESFSRKRSWIGSSPGTLRSRWLPSA